MLSNKKTEDLIIIIILIKIKIIRNIRTKIYINFLKIIISNNININHLNQIYYRKKKIFTNNNNKLNKMNKINKIIIK